MLIVKLVRWILGYVKFTAVGGLPERFINLCGINGVVIWDLRGKDGTFTACTAVKQYPFLRPFARKADIRLRVVERHGLPFLLHHYRRRLGLVVGVIVFASVLNICSSFLWSVEVQGNKTVSSEQIAALYEELGLKPGVRGKNLDLSSMELLAMGKMPELAWTNVNLYGSKAVIEVREAVIAPPKVAADVPCNIKAAMGGQVIRMEVYAGTPAVREGDSVVKGGLLVSGIYESKKETLSYHHARAKIIARTQRKEVVQVKNQKVVETETGKIRRQNRMEFFGLSIPLYFGSAPQGDYHLKEESKPIEIAGSKLPIALVRREFREVEKKTVTLTEEEMKALGKEEVEKRKKAYPETCKIIDEAVSMDFVSGECLYAVYFECEEEIGYEEAIQIENQQ